MPTFGELFKNHDILPRHRRATKLRQEIELGLPGSIGVIGTSVFGIREALHHKGLIPGQPSRLFPGGVTLPYIPLKLFQGNWTIDTYNEQLRREFYEATQRVSVIHYLMAQMRIRPTDRDTYMMIDALLPSLSEEGSIRGAEVLQLASSLDLETQLVTKLIEHSRVLKGVLVGVDPKAQLNDHYGMAPFKSMRGLYLPIDSPKGFPLNLIRGVQVVTTSTDEEQSIRALARIPNQV